VKERINIFIIEIFELIDIIMKN